MSATADPVKADTPNPQTAWQSFLAWLFKPIDAGLLVFFRISFGLLMTWEASRYLTSRFRGLDWIHRLFIEPQVLFKYYGFEWVHPWPGDGMYYHFWGLGFLGLLIAAGCFYRLAMTLFFLGFTFVFLQDQAAYLNHFYLISQVSFLMIFLPLNRACSVDAWLWPKIRSATAPAWTLWLLRFEVAIAYTFGGIAKMNPDWLRGEPMRSWLTERWGETPSELMVAFYSWGGMLFDLLIVPALLWPKTRIPAFLAALFFHFSNDQMFQIGVFPWFMVAGTLLFMPPEWVQLKASVGRKPHEQGKRKPHEKFISTKHTAIATLLILWVAFQCLVPFRHLLYPGNVSWTEEGHRFAWHMKLRAKAPDKFKLIAVTKSGRELAWYLDWKELTNEQTGLPYIDVETGQPILQEYLAFYAIDPSIDPSGNRIDLPDPAEGAITEKQIHGITTKPDMLLQFAHFLGRRLEETGYEPVAIYARPVTASLNNRPPQTLIDPDVNLLEVKRSLAHADWIVPLTTPLKPSWQPEAPSRTTP